VEQVAGVRFAALIDSMAPDPDAAGAALAEILHAARDLAAGPPPDPGPDTSQARKETPKSSSTGV
jgi:hypothetical protein